MWTRGELRSEVGENGEAVDVVSEFGGEITGVMGDESIMNVRGKRDGVSTPCQRHLVFC